MSRPQSRRASLIEAATNTVVGYLLAVVTQIAVFPIYCVEVDLSAHLGIGLAFTAVSLVRGYALRRVFEWLRVRG